MTEYVLNRKSNSSKDLNNKIKSYVNLNFRAYDKLNDIWIGGDEIDVDAIKKDSSRYFKEINIDYNGNLIEKIYVNGKEIDRNNALTKFIDNYSYGSRYFEYISTKINYSSEEKHKLYLIRSIFCLINCLYIIFS